MRYTGVSPSINTDTVTSPITKRFSGEGKAV